MAWRGVHLSRPARLSLADAQMVVDQDDGRVRLALEDLAWLILDTPQATMTAALLSACMDRGVMVITTDPTHLPNGLLLPFHGHHRQAGVADCQIGLSAPLKKRLWQSIVQRKIINQATMLDKLDLPNGQILHQMARHVRSGDPDNVEARAARTYWQSLFRHFRRDDDSDHRNKLLNYGYAVVRSAIARALVANGLLPAFGLHHASVGNAFNLADDLIEPFRPFVDMVATRLGRTSQDALSVSDRQGMAGILLADVTLDQATLPLLTATEQVSASLVRAMKANDPALLTLPIPPP